MFKVYDKNRFKSTIYYKNSSKTFYSLIHHFYTRFFIIIYIFKVLAETPYFCDLLGSFLNSSLKEKVS